MSPICWHDVSPRKPYRWVAPFLPQNCRVLPTLGWCVWVGRSVWKLHTTPPVFRLRKARSWSLAQTNLCLCWDEWLLASGFPLGCDWAWRWVPTQLLLIFASVIKRREWGETVGTARCELSVDFLETSSVGVTVSGAATAVSSRVCRGNT